MHITPYTPGCGAVVSGVQLAGLTEAQLADLRLALAEYGVLFLREQQFPPEEHLRFARRFGQIVLNKFFQPVPGFPEIAEVRKEKHQQTNIGGGWHTDHSYDEVPAMGSILVARQLPNQGGGTRFANLHAAYAGLPAAMKQKLAGLRAVHSNRHIYGENGFYRNTDLADQLGGMHDVGDATHPVIIRHPDSGREVLYVNPGHTLWFEGWEFDPSRALLEELYQHVDQPQYTCEFHWEPGSVTLWDNRSTWHFAQNDYQGEARLMHRITLQGLPMQAA